MAWETLPNGEIRHYGWVSKGEPPRNPTGKGGFRENPQNRSTEPWQRRHKPSYVMGRMLILTPAQLREKCEDNPDLTAVERMVYRQIMDALDDELKNETRAKLNELIFDRVEGRPPMRVDARIDAQVTPGIEISLVDASKEDDDGR